MRCSSWGRQIGAKHDTQVLSFSTKASYLPQKLIQVKLTLLWERNKDLQTWLDLGNKMHINQGWTAIFSVLCSSSG